MNIPYIPAVTLPPPEPQTFELALEPATAPRWPDGRELFNRELERYLLAMHSARPAGWPVQYCCDVCGGVSPVLELDEDDRAPVWVHDCAP